MKRVGFVIVMALISLMLIGCNNAAGLGSIDDLNAPVMLSKIPLRVCIDNMSTSRTIFPNDWSTETAEKLIFQLTGQRTSDENEALVLIDNQSEAHQGRDTFDYDELTSGSLTVNILPLDWVLTLTAYEKDGDGAPVTNKKVLIGTTKVDLTSNASNQTAIFRMKPVTADTDSTGDVDVKVIFITKDNLHHIQYALYNKDSDTVVGKKYTVYKPDTEGQTEFWNVAEEGGNTETSIRYTNDSVAPGEYDFAMYFYDETDKILGYYGDNVYVDPANTSQIVKTLADVINTPAPNPTSLDVAYSFNGDEGQELKQDEQVLDYYLATFTWDDNSDNETGFVLEIVDTAEKVASGEAYTPIIVNKNSPLAQDESSAAIGSIVDGSLDAGSTSCTVKLTTGKEYTASICATNIFDDENEDKTAYNDIVNMFTVTYNLSAGYVQKGSGSQNKTAADVLQYVKAYSYSISEQELLSGTTTTTPYVAYDGNNFDYWRYVSSSTKIDKIPAENKDNLKVEAVWKNPMSVSMEVFNYEGYKVDMAVDYDESSIYVANVGDTVTLSVATESDLRNVQWQLYDPDGTKNGEAQTSSTYTLNTADMDAGTYQVRLTAEKTIQFDGKDVTKNLSSAIYIKLEE